MKLRLNFGTFTLSFGFVLKEVEVVREKGESLM